MHTCHQDLFLLKNCKAEFSLWSLQCTSSSLFFSLSKRSKLILLFWQVNHSHAAFEFGPLARPNEKLIRFCTCLLHPAVWPLSRMSVWTTFRCLHSSSWNSHARSSPNTSGYLITVKPCDVKPSFNSVNLKPQKWQNLLESLFFFCFWRTQSHFWTTVHVKGPSQKLWPCYSVQWTQAAAFFQPLSIKVQLVTPKPSFEKASASAFQSLSVSTATSNVLCVFMSVNQFHVGLTAAAGPRELTPSFLYRGPC